MRPIAPTKADTALLEPFIGLDLSAIHVPKTQAEAEQAGREILEATVAGFDTESKPTFRPGEVSGGPHVVQFALPDRAFVFQLHRPGSRDVVMELLQSEKLIKVGFGLRNDRGQIGVRAAVGAVLKKRFHKSKRVTTSNWATLELTPAQLLYAANDAYAAVKVREALGIQ